MMAALSVSAQSAADPIDMNVTNPAELPLTVSDEPPFGLVPAYVRFTSPQDGWLYLRFAPSVTQIEYSGELNGEYKRLPHEYVVENNVTVGATAHIAIAKDETMFFRITGFNASTLTLSVENPAPGSSADFPIDITPGTIALPAEAGDYFYRITPAFEGFLEVTSSAPIPGGYVEVAFDGNGTGAFTIGDFIRLRKDVYDRMEYLIHFHKVAATAEAETVNVALTKAQPCDDIFDGEAVTPGQTYSTIPFAGTYYYKISVPQSGDHEIALTTLTAPGSPDTRANLFTTSDRLLSVARGLDMKYTAAAGTEYILQWTVFDLDQAISFKVDLTPVASIAEIQAAAAGNAEIFSLDGQRLSRVSAPGVYIIRSNGRATKTLLVR